MTKAQDRVIGNKGVAGVDGMKVSELSQWMKEHRTELILSIENGTYQPAMVLGVEIDKQSGGKRLLGYFRYANMQNKLKELDVWIRCRLRYCIWSRWKLSGGRNQTSACVATFEWV
ncbi:MAG: hypothetical protein PF486_10800 [Prolixibacteraceae bacterium]|nr:hypothetical protein [Prolixibacteraceae bacterium]